MWVYALSPSDQMDSKELSDSIKVYLYERSKSPFFAAYILSWVAVNWKFIYFILSSHSYLNVEDRIHYAEENLIDIHKSTWIPILYSFAIFLSSIALNLLYHFIRVNSINLRKKYIDRNELITSEERDRIIQYYTEKHQDMKNSIASKTIELSEQESEKEELTRQLDVLRNALHDKDIELSNLTNTSNETVLHKGSEQSYRDTEVQPTYERKDIIMASYRQGTHDTVSASALHSDEGVISIWANVQEFHLNNLEKKHLYILSHASNGGKKMIVGGAGVYKNSWAINVVTGLPSYFMFWSSNKNGTRTPAKLQDKRRIKAGWHLYTVAWSKKEENSFIRFYVDGDIQGQTKFQYWPDDIEATLVIGAWADVDQASHYFESKIGRFKAYDSFIGDDKIKLEFDTNMPSE